MHTARRIGGTGPARDKGDTGFARQLAMRLGHHGNAAFVSTNDGINAAFKQPIQRGQITFPRYAKDPLYPLGFQLIDKDLTAVTHSISPKCDLFS